MGKGFSLLELLIAVSVVAIISAIGFASYSQAQLIARDARRKADLRALKTGLELYRQNSASKLYPASTATVGITRPFTTGAFTSSGADPWITGLTTAYISGVPKDPRIDGGNPLSGTTTLIMGYSYWSGPILPA